MTDANLDLTPPTKAKKNGEVKEPKEPKVAKAPKEPKEPKAPSSRKKLDKTYPEDAKLTLLVAENPKKAGTRAHDIYEFYKSSQTVGEFFAATAGYVAKSGKKAPGGYGDITYDVGHGYIKVG